MDRGEIEARVRAIYEPVDGAPDSRTLFATDILWHVPGNNPVSGPYRGEDYFTLMPRRMAPLEEWRFTVKDVMVNEMDRAALVRFHVVGRRRGRTIDQDGAHMVRLGPDGRVTEGWGFAENQLSLDAFLSA